MITARVRKNISLKRSKAHTSSFPGIGVAILRSDFPVIQRNLKPKKKTKKHEPGSKRLTFAKRGEVTCLSAPGIPWGDAR